MAFHEFESLRHLMEADEQGAVTDAAFDDALWLLLCERIEGPSQAASFPEPVWIYYASRFMEWEVGNGGFGQAAYNIPEWFELAERAYRALDRPAAADLIGEARALLPASSITDPRPGGASVEELFEQFAGSDVAHLDERIDEADWWADDVRLPFVRRFREVFAGVA